ncbi:hypothetical protein BCON_0065g00260 [Botryotinia convoluta]|uniref:Uncharacterized protein n=1 Tax=Botryotinia convoluta TaxID=54673 RepID=A0A4Z1I7M2_9HELO|nr:hypothetical protein BCON_0065g00260 [Botryotinia convoluta]
MAKKKNGAGNADSTISNAKSLTTQESANIGMGSLCLYGHVDACYTFQNIALILRFRCGQTLSDAKSDFNTFMFSMVWQLSLKLCYKTVKNEQNPRVPATRVWAEQRPDLRRVTFTGHAL